VGLTFDDGYENFLHAALPVLERFGFSATVFVVSGMLGGENDWEHYFSPRPTLKLLGAAGVREVADRGMEIGSHSMSHPVLSGLGAERLKREVSDSRRILGEVLGCEVAGFCFPYGELDASAIRAVRRARYSYACAVNTWVGWTTYDLPRTPVADRDHLLRFAAKLRMHPHYRVAKRLCQRHSKASEQA
jgi:peptidoglycan/xylan/chitin deacetylase (PgdA/CDA1 family)